VSKITQLNELVTLGLEVLADTSELTIEQTWYRNGKRGALHFDRGCYKFEGLYASGETVQLSFAQVVGKRQCPTCCEYNVLNSSTFRLLSNMREAEQAIRHIGHLDTETKISHVGTGLAHVGNGRRALGRIREDQIDLVETSYRAYHDELDTLERILHEHVGALRDRMTSWCATNLMKSRRRPNPPGVDLTDLTLFGSESIEGSLESIYVSWCAKRRRGPEEAKAAALVNLQAGRLRSLEQCNFNVDDFTLEPGVSLLSSLEKAWHAATERRLVDKLLPYWELVWESVAGRTELRVLGMTGRLQHAESLGVVSAYPHHYLRDRSHVVVLAPEVVCRWLEHVEKRWDNTPQMGPACTPAELEIVAALWEPATKASSYNELGAAVEAAVNLQAD
jgi:hypothetical protein